jgi:hypothetical protein
MYYYHGDGLLDGGVSGHAQVVVAAPHSDLLRTPRELPKERKFKIKMTKLRKIANNLNFFWSI